MIAKEARELYQLIDSEANRYHDAIMADSSSYNDPLEMRVGRYQAMRTLSLMAKKIRASHK